VSGLPRLRGADGEHPANATSDTRPNMMMVLKFISQRDPAAGGLSMAPGTVHISWDVPDTRRSTDLIRTHSTPSSSRFPHPVARKDSRFLTHRTCYVEIKAKEMHDTLLARLDCATGSRARRSVGQMVTSSLSMFIYLFILPNFFPIRQPLTDPTVSQRM